MPEGLIRAVTDEAYLTALQPTPGCSITMAEAHLAAANPLFKQAEPALRSKCNAGWIEGRETDDRWT